MAGTSAPGNLRTRLKRFEFAKDFHVSPFMPMDMAYHWSFGEPGERLFVNMQNHQGRGAHFRRYH